jgi:TP901 family phage tail tape measure protein
MLLEAGDRVTRPLRDIAAGSSRAAQALKATRDRLKQLERAQSDIAGFRSLKLGLRATEGQMTETQARVAALARQMAAADNPTKKLAAEFAKAKREAAALSSEHTQQSARLQELRARLSAAGISTRDLVGGERDLRTAIERTNTELAEQERRLRTAADRSRRFGAARQRFGEVSGMATGVAAGGFSAIQTGEALGRPMLGAVETAMTFESTMTTIAQKANLTREEARQMGVQLLAAANAANQLPDALQAGVDTLSGFGMDPRKAVAMMAPIGRAATAYKAEIADLSSAGFAVIDNLKVPFQQTARVIDVMAAAGKSGAFEIKDMAQYFPTLTAASQALGQTGVPAVADLAAALQIARKGAGSSEVAATNVANVLQKISSPATIRAFKRFGIDLPAALKKAYAEGKTPLEAIAELTKRATGGDLGKIGFLFEDAQVQAGLRPLIQNLEEYRRIRAEALGAKGVTDGDFAERMQDAAERQQELKIGAAELSVTLGTMLLPTAVKVMGTINSGARAFMKWAKANPGLAKGLAITAAVLAGLFVVLGGGAIAVAALFGPIAILNAGLVALGVAGGVASIGLLPIIGTVAAIVAGLALLAGAAYLIYNNWSKITAFFSGLWQQVKTAFDGGLWGVLALLWKWQVQLLQILWGAVTGAVSWLVANFPAIWAGFKTVMWNVIWNGLLLLPRLFSQFGANTLRGFVQGMFGMLGWVKNAIVGVGSSVIGWFKKTLGIKSPSRVFAGLGGYMMEGLALGLDRGKGAPLGRISRLTAQMTAAMAAGAAVPAMAADAPIGRMQALSHQVSSTVGKGPRRNADSSVAAARGAPPVGDRYEITINAAPGMDEAKLVALLKRELDAIERAKLSNRNASFADTPDWEEQE